MAANILTHSFNALFSKKKDERLAKQAIAASKEEKKLLVEVAEAKANHINIPANSPHTSIKGIDALNEYLKTPVKGDVECIEVDLFDPNMPMTKGYYAVIARFHDGSAVTSNTNGVKFGPAVVALQDAGYTLREDPLAAMKNFGGSNRFSAGMFANTVATAKPLPVVSDELIQDKPMSDEVVVEPVDLPVAQPVSTYGVPVAEPIAKPMPAADSPVAALMTSFKQEVSKMEIPVGDNKILEQTTITSTTTISSQ